MVAPDALPVQVTSFVGRTAELAAVRDLLIAARVVTLTGVGGCGKTRLAVQVAADRLDHDHDGVFWVELVGVDDPMTVIAQVASAFGALLDPAQEPVQQLRRQLRDRRALVCLDNCEQVLAGVADLVDPLIRSCPGLTVLVTSREPLGIEGEIVFPVPPLSEEDAVALFAERAGAVRPSFTLNGSNESSVRALCRRLDRLPLALELAAAWSRTLTPKQIEAGLDDRFALLVRSPRGAATRHRSLAASIDWSYELLEESDRLVLVRLAPFAGGFTLAAALDVCAGGPVARGDVLGCLGRLVDKSLVVADARGPEARYRLLETIREYAARRLEEDGATAACRDRHLLHFLALTEAAEPMLDRDEDAWRELVEPEHDNIRAALDWGLAAVDPDWGRRLAASSSWIWGFHVDRGEGVAYLQRAVARAPDDRSLLQARLLTAIAVVADAQPPQADDAAHRGLEIATEHGDERLRARCLSRSAFGNLAVDLDRAWELGREAQRAAQAAPDGFARDSALALQGIVLQLHDRHDEARSLLRLAEDGFVQRADRGMAAGAVSVQAGSALFTGDITGARKFAERAARLAEGVSDYRHACTTRVWLAAVRGAAGEVRDGLELLLPLAEPEGGTEPSIPGTAHVIGELLLRSGDLTGAAEWLGRAAPDAGPAANAPVTVLALPAYADLLRRTGRTEEAGAVLDRAVGLARRFDMPRVLAAATEQRGHLAADDDPERAADLHHSALSIRLGCGLRTYYIDSLDALAVVLLRAERPLDAARLTAAMDRARTEIGYPRPLVDGPAHGAALAGIRDALGPDGFGAAWSEGTAMTLDEVVALVRRRRGTRSRPSSGWASLTPTELEVVRLAVEGLSNPAIADRLFIGRGTVKTHLSHVYAKLGVANRTELASFAAPRMEPAD